MHREPHYGIDRRKHDTIRLPAWLITLMWGMFLTMTAMVYQAGQLVQRVDNLTQRMDRIERTVEAIERKP